MTTVLLAGMTLLAQEGPRNTGPDFGKASPFGLLIGTFGLVWSMNRHLKNLPESFDPEHPEPDQAVDEGTAAIVLDHPVGDEPRESGGQPPG